MPVGDSSSFHQEAPRMILYPGIAISLAVFAFNLFGDSLRDWLNPKFRI
jgi:peptide/nickel transport system permease protein